MSAPSPSKPTTTRPNAKRKRPLSHSPPPARQKPTPNNQHNTNTAQPTNPIQQTDPIQTNDAKSNTKPTDPIQTDVKRLHPQPIKTNVKRLDSQFILDWIAESEFAFTPADRWHNSFSSWRTDDWTVTEWANRTHGDDTDSDFEADITDPEHSDDTDDELVTAPLLITSKAKASHDFMKLVSAMDPPHHVNPIVLAARDLPRIFRCLAAQELIRVFLERDGCFAHVCYDRDWPVIARGDLEAKLKLEPFATATKRYRHDCKHGTEKTIDPDQHRFPDLDNERYAVFQTAHGQDELGPRDLLVPAGKIIRSHGTYQCNHITENLWRPISNALNKRHVREFLDEVKSFQSDIHDRLTAIRVALPEIVAIITAYIVRTRWRDYFQPPTECNNADVVRLPPHLEPFQDDNERFVIRTRLSPRSPENNPFDDSPPPSPAQRNDASNDQDQDDDIQNDADHHTQSFACKCSICT